MIDSIPTETNTTDSLSPKQIKTCWVGLYGVQVTAPIGVHSFEREQGNQFLIDFEIRLKQHDSIITDELDRTIDYGLLYQAIVKAFAQPAFLIEYVAGRILEDASTFLPQHKYKLRISKLSPAIPGAAIGHSFVKLKGRL